MIIDKLVPSKYCIFLNHYTPHSLYILFLVGGTNVAVSVHPDDLTHSHDGG